MAKKGTKRGKSGDDASATTQAPAPPPPSRGKPSALLDTRVIYCSDNLEQLAKLPDRSLPRAQSSGVDLIYLDPPLR